MSVAYEDFRKRYEELHLLHNLGRELEAGTPRNLPLEISLARSIVVLIAGHLEGYMNALAEEVIGHLPDDPELLTASQRRYLAIRLRDFMVERSKELKEATFGEGREVDAFLTSSESIHGWLQKPSSLPHIEKIRGFYRDLAPDAVDQLFRRLHPLGSSFWGWIESKGKDRSRFCTVLKQLVEARSGIAHGEIDIRPTLNDARLYIATATALVRASERFILEFSPQPNSRNGGEP